MCGVVWCGLVWCGVLWCGVLWSLYTTMSKHLKTISEQAQHCPDDPPTVPHLCPQMSTTTKKRTPTDDSLLACQPACQLACLPASLLTIVYDEHI